MIDKSDEPFATAAARGQHQPPKPGVIKMGPRREEVLPPATAATYDRLVQVIDGVLNATRHIALDDRGAFFRPARRYPNPTLLATEVAQAICDSGMVADGT